MNDLLIICGLIILNGVFSMSEVALISARKSKLSADAKSGNRNAAVALALSEDPERFLSTVQIGITLIGILTGIYSGATIAGDFGAFLATLGMKPSIAMSVAKITIVVVVTFLSIVVGELVPKKIGMNMADTISQDCGTGHEAVVDNHISGGVVAFGFDNRFVETPENRQESFHRYRG